VGRPIQWRNVSAFNGGAVAEEEDERTVSSQNDSVFQFQRLLSIWSSEFLYFCNQAPN